MQVCELAGFRTCSNCVRVRKGHDSGVAEENIWVGGRQLHNKELHNLAQIPSERENEGDMMAGSCSMCDTKMRNAYKYHVGTCEGKRSLRRPRHKWRAV